MPAKEIRLPAFASRLTTQVTLRQDKLNTKPTRHALSFALFFNLLAVALIMAVGTAATISLAGVLPILGKEDLLLGLSRKERTRQWRERLIER